jgi:hypothetical protein
MRSSIVQVLVADQAARGKLCRLCVTDVSVGAGREGGPCPTRHLVTRVEMEFFDSAGQTSKRRSKAVAVSFGFRRCWLVFHASRPSVGHVEELCSGGMGMDCKVACCQHQVKLHDQFCSSLHHRLQCS